jgi:hypothetical protein
MTTYIGIVLYGQTLFNPKSAIAAGMYAAKALVQHLCERFHDPENVHIFSPAFRYSTEANSAFKRF